MTIIASLAPKDRWSLLALKLTSQQYGKYFYVAPHGSLMQPFTQLLIYVNDYVIIYSNPLHECSLPRNKTVLKEIHTFHTYFIFIYPLLLLVNWLHGLKSWQCKLHI